MAARTWFNATNTPTLRPVDRSIMNTAARKLVDGGHSPTHTLLSRIRTSYEAGRSANDVIERVEDIIEQFGNIG